MARFRSILALTLTLGLGLGALHLLLGSSTALADPIAKARAPAKYAIQKSSKKRFERLGVSEQQWKAQLAEVNSFRKNINAALDKRPIGLFETISLAPRGKGESALELPTMARGKCLVIRPKVDAKGQLQVISAKEIAERWNSGEPVGLTKSKVRRAAAIGRFVPFGPFGTARKAIELWKNYNPLAERRLIVTRIVGSEARRLKDRLDGIHWAKVKDGAALERARSFLVDLVSGHTLDRQQTLGAGPVRADVLKKIEVASKGQLEAFARRMSDILANGENAQAAADAALVGGAFQRSESFQQLQKAWFSVAAVQNHKRVDVEAMLNRAPNYANFEAFVPKSAKGEIVREQKGLALLKVGGGGKGRAAKASGKESVVMKQDIKFSIFMGQFVDDVDVQAHAVLGGGQVGSALPTYALQQALSKLDGNAK